MSNVQEMQRLGYDNRRRGDEYATLPRDYMDCDACGACEKVCPKKFDIHKRLEGYDATCRESRARAASSFAKSQR